MWVTSSRCCACLICISDNTHTQFMLCIMTTHPLSSKLTHSWHFWSCKDNRYITFIICSMPWLFLYCIYFIWTSSENLSVYLLSETLRLEDSLNFKQMEDVANKWWGNGVNGNSHIKPGYYNIIYTQSGYSSLIKLLFI